MVGFSLGCWWHVRVGRAEFDWRILLEAGLELTEILNIGSATQVLYGPTSRASFRSVSRLMTFGNGSFCGTSNMFSCQIRCIFQFRHLTAVSRSAT